MAQQFQNPHKKNHQKCSMLKNNHHESMFSDIYRSNKPDVQLQMQINPNSLNKMKISNFIGQSWDAFSEAVTDESSDEEIENEDPLALPTSSTKSRQHRESFVRLKRYDIPIYGYCPETDSFAVVTCQYCHKIIKSTALKQHMDKRHDEMVKTEKTSNKCGKIEKVGKIDKIGKIIKIEDKVKNISVTEKSNTIQKRHREVQRKSSLSDNSNDAAPMQIEVPSQPLSLPTQVLLVPQPPTVIIPSESSSASNSPQPRRKKRKIIELPQLQQPVPIVTSKSQQIVTNNTETFQMTPLAPSVPQQQTIVTAKAAPTACRILMSSSPPPLAPITKTNEAPTSVWIVTPSPAVIIDGSFVMKPLEAEMDTEIDIKDLKVLKAAIKGPQTETSTQLTSSNWYSAQPRPLAFNTFNMKKINGQRYVLATQRKLVELNRTLKQDDKISNAVVKPQPKTWSFIERGQLFIHVTH